MNLLLIGTSVEDYIYIDGNVIHKGGGILYSTAALISFVDEVILYLLTNISKDTEQLFNDIYSDVRNDFIEIKEKIPQIHLKLYKDKERDEEYKNLSNKLNIIEKEIKFNHFDGILINMITGFDIDLKDLKYIRENYNGIIYMDVHSLARGLNENLGRPFKKIENFDQWLRNIDILQVNESEIQQISKYDNVEKIIPYVFECGTKIVVLTLGEKGSIIYENNGNVYNISAYKTTSNNTVGCGDTYGALFFYHYLKTNDIKEAAKIASKGAAIITNYKEIIEFKRLKYEL